MVESDYATIANDQGGKSHADVEKILKDERSRLDGILTESLSDPSLHKIMELFSRSKFVLHLSKTLTDMFDIIPSLHQFAGKEEINQLHALFHQFTELLIVTKKTIKNVSEQAKIQQESLEDLIENIKSFEQDLNNNSNNNNGQFDKSEFKDSINTLSQWISDKAVSVLIKDWDVFCKQCQV